MGHVERYCPRWWGRELGAFFCVFSRGESSTDAVGKMRISLFRPSSTSAPLVLLHPLAVFGAAELFAVDFKGEGEAVDKERKAALKAWKRVEKVLKVVRSRTVLVRSFLPSNSFSCTEH